MPDLMLRYRAATFLVRCTAPEIGLGLMTREELDDTVDGKVTNRRVTTAVDIGNLLEVAANETPVVETPDEEYADA
jgi:hypothetical protein